MFRKGRPLSPWLHFGLHFGVILGAKFATILLFGRPGVQIGRKKGESKKFGNGTVLCVDRNLKVDTTAERAEGDILIMLTNDEYPDDTIKIRFKIGAIIDDDRLEIQDQSTYYLDSEGQENPLNYSNFLELYQILDDLVYNRSDEDDL